jgi:hypothetical protein
MWFPWKPHLQAAMNMFWRCREMNMSQVDLSQESRTIISQDLPVPRDNPVATEQVQTHRFLTGTILWFDIVASMTEGTAPYLLQFHSKVLAPDSQTDLATIMGCRNWVMLQIGRISALYARKAHALELGQYNAVEIEETVADISNSIYSGLAQESLDPFSISEIDLPQDLLITHLFAFTALIYLHLVARGFDEVDMLYMTLAEALRKIRCRLALQSLPGLLSALFIIGCAASPAAQHVFRDTFSSVPMLDPALQHRARVLPIFEEIWRRRQMAPGLVWKDVLDLTGDILLV